MQTIKQQKRLNTLIMRDQKDRPQSKRRRHEVNINEHCLDDFYCEQDKKRARNGFFIGVAFWLCAVIVVSIIVGW